MNVLMVCSELDPIVKVGHLGDAVAALARTLSRLEHKVTVALPRYPAIDESGLMLARRLTPLHVEVKGERVDATLFDARLSSGVELLLVDLPKVFEGPDIYGSDDARRFGLFSRAVAELVRARQKAGTPFEVVHAHDWQTALVPYLLKRQESDVRTVLTVHDGRAQGRFPRAVLEAVGLDPDDFHPSGPLEFYGDVCFLKAGVLTAGAVATVSQGYAEALQAEASGLEGVFRSRGADLVGILEGIDYGRWSPATDPHIAARFDAEDVSNKGRCKAALLNELDLSLEPERPLIALHGAIDEDGGIDVLARALGAIARSGARLLIAGEGDPALASLLEDACAGMEEDALFLGKLSEPAQHRLVAAADAVLVTSRYEPCGTWQQYGQRYGAVPIAHAAGGLRDTIVDCDAHCETGTGFLFGELTPEAIAGAVGRAVSAMQTPRWAVLRRRVMRLDRSWESPARRYARLYQA
jgi:starch synthase